MNVYTFQRIPYKNDGRFNRNSFETPRMNNYFLNINNEIFTGVSIETSSG